MIEKIIAIFFVIGMGIFALGMFILAQHKDEIWEKIISKDDDI